MKTHNTILHIHEVYTQLSVEGDKASSLVLTLVAGSQKTASDFFKHVPPTPYELEIAIAAIEDEIMRVQKLMTPYSTLSTSDAKIREIAHIAGILDAPLMHLSLQNVEQIFNRLTSLSQGRPVTNAGIPNSAEFAATLLILRELMHHMQFEKITITRD